MTASCAQVGLMPVEDELHRVLEVVRERGDVPAVLAQGVRLDAVARPAELAREAGLRGRELHEARGDPVGDRVHPGDPGVVRVLRVEVGLDDALALEEPVVELGEDVRGDDVVGVDHDDGVEVALVGEGVLHREADGLVLAAQVGVVALEDGRAGRAGVGGGRVGAVVGDDEDLEELARVVDGEDALDGLRDHLLLVVGGDEERERLLRGRDLLLGFLRRPKSETPKR